MSTPQPRATPPVAIAIGAFLLGSAGIMAVQHYKENHRLSVRANIEAKAAQQAELCISSPSKSGCSSIDHKLLSVDVSSRLRSALLRNKQSDNTSPNSRPAIERSSSINLYSICKRYIGEIMGRDPSTMSSEYLDQSGRVAGISYVRPADGKLFKYECKTDGQTVIWRGIDIFAPGGGPGRWRDEDSRSVALYQ